MEDFAIILLMAALAFGICIWIWRAFGWRWHPGPPMLLVGLGLVAVTGGFCLVMTNLPLNLGCRASYSTSKWIGAALGTFTAGCLVLIASPVVAFWRRALAERRHEA